MKILGIIALIEIFLLIIASTVSGLNINIFLTAATTEVMAGVFGGLIIIYPATNLIMHSKIKLKKYHFFGIFITTLYTTLTMLILAALFRDAKYIKTEHAGYYIPIAFSVFVIWVLRRKHGIKADEVKL